MAKGISFGCKPKLTEHQPQEAIARRDAGETLASIAKSYNVDLSIRIASPFEASASV
jgi:hypothetical protein